MRAIDRGPPGQKRGRRSDGNGAPDLESTNNSEVNFTSSGPSGQGWAALPIVKNARESIRTSIESYRDHVYVDLRLYADNGVEHVPTRKGIAIRPDLLPQVIEALRIAEVEARRRGLL